jgi:hypothetical protein
MCDAYNRWLGDVLSGQERLKWVGVANLDDISAAVQQVKEAKQLGAVGMMILGTAGDRLLDDQSLLPFYEAVATKICPSPSMLVGPVRRSIISIRISIHQA